VLVSTGVANRAEITETLSVLREAGCREPAFLHCVSAYPAKTEDMNLRALDWLSTLGCPVGLSDHTLDTLAATLAVARGASFIEKHFTLSRADGGPDASFSLEPREFAELVGKARDAWAALGDARILAQERRPGAEHARSLFVVQRIAKGEALTSANVRAIRPGLGLPPRALRTVLGRRARRDLERGEPLRREDVE
jgi:N-acetylneuraminate synthase